MKHINPKCKRCGKCCHRGDFWQLSEHPKVKSFANEFSIHEEDGPCLMFRPERGSIKSYCLIEKLLGYDAKPNVCKEYNCETD